MFESFLAYPAWLLVGLAGLVLGFLGAGILGAGIVGAGLNFVLNWASLIVPSNVDWTSTPWEWVAYLFGVPSVDVTQLLYVMAVGAIVGAMASYLGIFLRKQMGGIAI